MVNPELSKWLDEDRKKRIIDLSGILRIEIERRFSNLRWYFNKWKQLIDADLEFKTDEVEVVGIADTIQTCEQYFQELENAIHKMLRKKSTKYFIDYSDDEWERYFARLTGKIDARLRPIKYFVFHNSILPKYTVLQDRILRAEKMLDQTYFERSLGFS
jgi:hypothetical protein